MSDPAVISVHQAKRRLSHIVKSAAAGETILIGPNGQALVKVTALGSKESPKRHLGFLKGKLEIPPDFDAPLPDESLRGFSE